MLALVPTALFGLPPEEAAAIGTIALALVAVISLFLSYRLFKLTQQQNAESHGQNLATLRLTAEQLELNRVELSAMGEQVSAMTRQVETAERALAVQITPNLIPAGVAAARIGPPEPIMREPQHIEVTPTFLGVINAGNGVAIFDTERASATCGPDGGRGGMGIVVPPALAGGAEGQIKLTPQVGGGQVADVGIIYNLEIPYQGAGQDSPRLVLRFTAQFFNEQHWEIKIVHPE
jgi:hypothetical protein